MSRTEAKRRYIEALIETMKSYASGTQESRELVGELEFVWGQIRSQGQSVQSGSGSGSEGKRSGGRSTGGSGGVGKKGRKAGEDEDDEEDIDGESPRRSGMKGLGSDIARNSASMASSRRFPPVDSEGRRMRMLSPMSPREGSDIVEGREARDIPADDDDHDDIDGLPNTGRAAAPPGGAASSRFAALEAQLRRLSTEVAALREQLSANHLLSSSSYSFSHAHLSPYQYSQQPLRKKILYRLRATVRLLLWFCVRQVVVGMVVLGVVVVWGRSRGDRRAEEWARRRWKEMRSVLGTWAGRVWEGDEGGWWVGLGWLVRMLRWRGKGLLGGS